VLLVPAQNIMRRDKAPWWQHRVKRVHEMDMWLAWADVTSEQDDTRVGLGPICVICRRRRATVILRAIPIPHHIEKPVHGS
jgi:hypothetical protein